jgi:hypothetical protein
LRIAQMPGASLTADLITQVSRTAGLPFAAYDFGGSPRACLFRPSGTIFPGRHRAITVQARRRGPYRPSCRSRQTVSEQDHQPAPTDISVSP